MVLETDNPKILDSIKNIFKKQVPKDFWDAISKSEKDDILSGIQEIEKGEIVDYEELMSKHRWWIGLSNYQKGHLINLKTYLAILNTMVIKYKEGN